MNARAVGGDTFSISRFMAILMKEFVQMRRDRLTFAMIVGIPILQLVLFGYAINSDPKHLPAAVLLADNGPQGRTLLFVAVIASRNSLTVLPEGWICMRLHSSRQLKRIGFRTGSPLSCLLIDLDDFKRVNDLHGHQAGDAVLRAVVHALVGEFRAFDRVARYGGDEFVVILPNADLRSAAAAGARALERLLTVPAPDGSGPGSLAEGGAAASVTATGISASIGVAEWHAPMSTDDLIEACDAALLRSKREGKGRVTRAAEPAY